MVSLQWKLPARLRRPVRQELARQRRQQRAREAIVRFERRPIYTELPSEHPPYHQSRATPARNRGAEFHTGDVYKQSRPHLQLQLPPYAGRFVRSALTPVQSRRNQASPVPRNFAAPTVRAAPAQPLAVRRRRQHLATQLMVAGERDVPFRWETGEPTTPARRVPVMQPAERDGVPAELSVVSADPTRGSIREPKRWLSFPFHISIIPRSLFSSKQTQEEAEASRPVRQRPNRGRLLNVVVLLIGCLAASGLVWNLRNAGRGFSVLASVENQAQAAFGHLVSAQTALAETNFTASEQEFAEAAALLEASDSQLQEALASSHLVLRYLDVTGTVRSGQELLDAGQYLSDAGQSVSRGLAPLFGARLLPGPDASQPSTLLAALETAQHELGSAVTDLEKAETALNKVDSPFLPNEIRDQVVSLQGAVPAVRQSLQKFVDQGDALLQVLGADRQKQYLVLFQNHHEIRPTGGFIGSFGLVNVDRGVVEDIDVSSVYDPDGQLKERIAPPDPLLRITNRWYMRDANWFADYSISAEKIAAFFEKEGGPTVDGVIALTPVVLQDLLAVTGPIEVPGYGVTVTADNFITLTQEQVTYDYEESLNKPKQFLADLAPLLLNRLFSLPPAEGLRALGALKTGLDEKNLLLSFRDEGLQSRVEAARWGGTLPQLADGQDFLNVINANVGGHKSDQFVSQELDYRVSVAETGEAEVVLTIRRTHHGPEEQGDAQFPAGENPALKDNVIYQRVLVPLGAELLDARGFTAAADIPRLVEPESDLALSADADVAEWQRLQHQDPSGTMIGQEAGRTFFANWLVVRPGETGVALYRYRLPGKVTVPNVLDAASRYALYLAKQPGDVRTTVRVEIQAPESVRIAHTVPSDGITAESAHTAVYRGALRRDVLVGAVLENQ